MKLPKKHVSHLQHLILILLTGFLTFVFLLIGANLYFDKIYPKSDSVALGISFSKEYTESLELDWKETYLDILTNLKVKNLRLNTYWQQVEPMPGRFNFDNLDYMLKLAKENQAQVLLVIGEKQPRWPECYIPVWAQNLPLSDRRQKVLTLLETIVEKYKDDPTIVGWQVENEPIFDYGTNCDPVDRAFLKQEVELVKQIDPTRPIIVSDSGELRFWRTPMMLSNIFGTTLYRTVHNPIFGYFYWPLPPAAYRLKSNLVRQIFAPGNQKTIIVELQTEPWVSKPLIQASVEEQIKIFPLKDLSANVDFAKKTGFDQVYLWGVEWWYFMAKQGHPEYLDQARTFFQSN